MVSTKSLCDDPDPNSLSSSQIVPLSMLAQSSSWLFSSQGLSEKRP